MRKGSSVSGRLRAKDGNLLAREGMPSALPDLTCRPRRSVQATALVGKRNSGSNRRRVVEGEVLICKGRRKCDPDRHHGRQF